MKPAIAISCLAFAVAVAAFAQAPDFARKAPAWQIALTAAGDATAGATIATKGKGAALACVTCHGANGAPAADASFPRLAGLPAEYLGKQLFDYRDGARQNNIMVPIAKALDDAEIASLARYYASLQMPTGKSNANPSERGWQLARYGDNANAIPACVDCHGADWRGGGPILPGLAQPALYTSAQLNAFRSGERKNDGDGVMQAFAKRMSDADIESLAKYYASE
jgi:cytochrome c553